MFSKDQLSYEAVPLPNRLDLTDEEALQAATEFFDFMATRHTVRDFAPTPVPRSVIEQCVKAAGRAPSGANH